MLPEPSSSAMIRGYHLIFGAYGFWLPNDPRGSWSDFVGSWELFRYGSATKSGERHTLQESPLTPQQFTPFRQHLKRPPVQFDGEQARAIGTSFRNYFERIHLPVWACAILPDHVHLVLARPEMDVEQLVIQLKGEATSQLKKQCLHPFGNLLDRRGRIPKCFARGEWKVYLDLNDIELAIRYVEENPAKEGKPPQMWSFVVPWET
jgi:REP element-mobilizing transposase RayT